MALYWQGKATRVTTTMAEMVPVHTAITSALTVDWLVNEHCDTLVIEGHVDLPEAAKAMHREGATGFPEPRHAWMRYMKVPDGELDESDDRSGWRGECPHDARGAEPVTISVKTT